MRTILHRPRQEGVRGAMGIELIPNTQGFAGISGKLAGIYVISSGFPWFHTRRNLFELHSGQSLFCKRSEPMTLR